MDVSLVIGLDVLILAVLSVFLVLGGFEKNTEVKEVIDGKEFIMFSNINKVKFIRKAITIVNIIHILVVICLFGYFMLVEELIEYTFIGLVTFSLLTIISAQLYEKRTIQGLGIALFNEEGIYLKTSNKLYLYDDIINMKLEMGFKIPFIKISYKEFEIKVLSSKYKGFNKFVEFISNNEFVKVYYKDVLNYLEKQVR